MVHFVLYSTKPASATLKNLSRAASSPALSILSHFLCSLPTDKGPATRFQPSFFVLNGFDEAFGVKLFGCPHHGPPNTS